MSFHGSPRHFQFGGDFCVVAALQKQLDYLLFARTQPNRLLHHPTPPDFLHRLRPVHARLIITNSHSIHIAILRQGLSVTPEHPFPQAFADGWIPLLRTICAPATGDLWGLNPQNREFGGGKHHYADQTWLSPSGGFPNKSQFGAWPRDFCDWRLHPDIR